MCVMRRKGGKLTALTRTSGSARAGALLAVAAVVVEVAAWRKVPLHATASTPKASGASSNADAARFGTRCIEVVRLDHREGSTARIDPTALVPSHAPRSAGLSS